MDSSRSEIMSKGGRSGKTTFENISSRGNYNPSKHVLELKSQSSNLDIRRRVSSAGGKSGVRVQEKLLNGKSLIRPQVILSHKYILDKVFRKDGPSLGIAFDHIPENAFGRITGVVIFQIIQFFFGLTGFKYLLLLISGKFV